MSTDFDVIVTGFDVEQRQAETGMIRLFGLDPQRARRFVEQLPVIAKQCPDPRSAERYADALRAIGARVEVRPHAQAFRGSLPPVAATSLPPPAPELTRRMQESLRVSRAADSAIARFREAEGLDEIREDGNLDLYNPAIPKAPAVPHDLSRMPNAAPPKYSDRPEWVMGDPLSLTPGASGVPMSGAPAHADAKLPPPRERASIDSGMRARTNTGERNSSIGLAHAGRASVRPGLMSHTLRDAPPPASLRARLARRWPWLLAGAVVVAGAAAWQAGLLESEADERRARWQAEGIDAGEHVELRAFLEQPGHELLGLDDGGARKLLDKLERAGAPGVHAIGVEEQGGRRRAKAVLIELPREPEARKTVLFHLAEARGQGKAPIEDRGERQVVVAFR